MRKLKYFLVLCLTMFLLFGVTSKEVQAENNQEFQNVTFESSPKLSDSKKVVCKISFKTTDKIYYIKVNAVLQNNTQQTFEVYEGASTKDGKQSFTSKLQDDNKYLNVLIFDLYYYQTGNMQVTFNYSYTPITPGSDTLVKTFVFVSGDWKTKQTPTTAIICGVVITICMGLATYIIIENSERSIVFGHNQDEEEDEEWVFLELI